MSEINPLSIADEDLDLFMEASDEVDAEEEETEVEEVVDLEEEEEDATGTQEEDVEEAVEDEEADIDASDEDEEVEDEVEEEEEEEEASLSVDDMEKVFAPFRANGAEMQVNSADDAIALMQMGANYNVKMASIKPLMKYSKMLEKHGLLDEGKLSYLIDLHNKNPAAVKQLVKDSEVDVLDLDFTDEDNTEEYVPNDYSVSDTEVKFDTVIADLKSTESFQETMSIVTDSWDTESKDALVQDPELLRTINDHVASGLYKQLDQIVQRERMFNRIPLGYSNLEAYEYVGNLMAEQGAFDETATAPTKEKITNVDSKKKEEANASRIARKKAAGSSKNAATEKAEKKEVNPLNMSDAEFLASLNT